MDIIDDLDDAIVVDTLADALGIGLDLVETFGLLGDFCAHAGVILIDEIAVSDDELRSIAVTTFTDEPGWDDVTDRLFPVE